MHMSFERPDQWSRFFEQLNDAKIYTPAALFKRFDALRGFADGNPGGLSIPTFYLRLPICRRSPFRDDPNTQIGSLR